MNIVVCGLVCAATLVCYWHTVHYPFAFDDGPNITENDALRIDAVTVDALRSVVVDSHLRRRPVANISFALNYRWGQLDPAGYRVVNLIIHAVNGILVYALVLVLMGYWAMSWSWRRRVGVAAFTTLIWVVHPIQTQSVTYIVQRMTSLSALFYLLAVLAYVHGRGATTICGRTVRMFVTVVAGALAVMTKEIAITLPVTIVLIELYCFCDFRIGCVFPGWRSRMLATAATIIAVGAVTAVVSPGRVLAGYATRDFTMGERVLTQLRVLVGYLSRLLIPHPARLNLDYDIAVSQSLFSPATTVVSAGILGGLVVLAWRVRRSTPVVSFAVVWFFVHLAVESTILPLELVYEHRLYLPSFGVVFALVYLVARMGPHCRWCTITIAALTISVFSLWTYQRNRVWRDPIVLWQDCVDKSACNERANSNLGMELARAGHVDRAIDVLQTAIGCDPSYVNGYLNLSSTLVTAGRIADALSPAVEAIRLAPGNVDARRVVGNVYVRLGQFDRALPHLRIAQNGQPTAVSVHVDIAKALIGIGQPDEALVHVHNVIERYGLVDAQLYNNLGTAYAAKHDYARAADAFRDAITLAPTFALAHRNYGNALRDSGQLSAAEEAYSRALKIEPTDTIAQFNIGRLRLEANDIDGALMAFEKLLATVPRHVRANNDVGRIMLQRALATTESARQRALLTTALSHFLIVLQERPGVPGIYSHVAACYAKLGRFSEAIYYYEQALAIEPDNADARANLPLLRGVLEKERDGEVVPEP